MSDRAIHSPEYQTGMHIHRDEPACFTPNGVGTSPRALNFYDQGRSCGCASTEEQWMITLAHTPGCLGCARAFRALMIEQGLIEPDPRIPLEGPQP